MKAMIKWALILLLGGRGAHALAAPAGGDGTMPDGDPAPPALAATPSDGDPGYAADASAGAGIGNAAVPPAGKEGEAESPQEASSQAGTAELPAASPTGDAAPVPTAAPAVEAPVAAGAPPPRIQKIVRFKNGSVLTCSILGEERDKIVVEMFGGQMDIPRDEIDYYGDPEKLPSVKREEIVITGEAAAPTAPSAAVEDAAAPAPPDLRPKPSGQVGAPASAPALRRSVPAPLSVTAGAATVDDLNASPEKYQGERIVFPEMVMGVLQKIDGIYGLELLPPNAKKGQRRHGGTSPELTTRGVTFILSEAQAADLKEHSKPYDRARIECTVERRTIGNVAYWVAPVSRIDVYQREGGGIAWTIW